VTPDQGLKNRVAGVGADRDVIGVLVVFCPTIKDHTSQSFGPYSALRLHKK
jgi:hypothetical protein